MKHSEIRLFCCRLPDPTPLPQLIRKSLKFYFVRHPFQRLISAYRNKVEKSYRHKDGQYFYDRYGRKIVQIYRKNRRKTFSNEKLPSSKAKKILNSMDNWNMLNNTESKLHMFAETDKIETREKEKVGKTEEQELVDDVKSLNQKRYKREPTFQEFVDYLIDTDVQDYDKHWRPISVICHVCDYDFKYIIKYENFKEEVDYLIYMLQQRGMLPSNFQLHWENRENTNAEVTAKYLSLVSDHKLWQLYDKYRLDFIYFGYTMEGYINKQQ